MALINATAIPDAADYELEQSLKTNDGDSSYLSWTPSSAGNQRTWTWSAWVKRGELGSVNTIFGAGNGGTIFDEIRFDASDRLEWFTYASSVNGKRVSTAVFRDVSAWYHIIAVYDSTNSTEANRMKLYVNGEQLTSFSSTTHPSQNHQGNINNNIIHAVGAVYAGQLYNPYDGYLSEVNFIDGQALTPTSFGETGDYGEWKPIEYSGTYGTNGFYLPFKQDYTVEGFSTVTWRGNGVSGNYIGGTGFKPDFTWIKQRSGVYSHVLADSVRGNGKFLSSANTGVEDPDFTKFQNFATDGFTVGTHAGVNSSGQTYVAWNWDMGSDTPTGFGAVAYKGGGARHQVDGFGFAPSLVWIKDRDGAESHSINDIVRGTQKRLQSNGTDAEDAGGITKFNPDGFTTSTGYGSDGDGSGHNFIAWGWDMGDTTVTNTSGSLTSQVRANPTYGQSIVKYTGNTASSATVGHGLNSAPEFMIVRTTAANAWAVYHTSIGNTHLLEINTTAGKADNNEFWNDTSPTNSVFTIGSHNEVNHTQDYIAYCFHSVSGYSKFGSYSGSGGSGNAQTLGFRPAFLMVKRTDSTGDWAILDSTRVPLNPVDKAIRANSSVVEDDLSSNYQVTFTDTGFSFSNYGYNETGSTYIYMAFAGGMDSISDYNTDGTIDSRVKANPTYGQSIVSYEATGSASTVGHGLSSAPEMMIVKHRDQAGTSWIVYNHQMATSNSHHKYLKLNSDSALTDDINAWNDTAPTSSVFSIGPNGGDTNNSSGGSTIAYLWHSVSGYSSIGRYTGNGSATGPTITTGFRPAWIMIKPSTVVDHWNVYDTTRDPQNPINHLLFPNRDNAEGTGQDIEISDTGFQIKTNNTGSNQNGEYYIYMAFADKREYAYWLDQSGNNNDWTSNNLTESDISVDSPSNNFATLNPLGSPSQSGVIGYSEGNLRAVHSGTNLNSSSVATIGLPNSGKYYWEVNIVEGDSHYVGVAHNWHLKQNNNDWIFAQGGWSYRYNGAKYSDGTANSYGDAYDDGDIVGVAVDIDNSKIYFSKNGVWQNSSNPATSTNPAFTNVSGDNLTVNFGEGSSNTHEYIANFGQDSSFAGKKTAQGNQDGNEIGDFYYTPPTGFLALCTSNLPDVAVVPQEHFNTVLYTGTGNTSTNAITGVGFQPDLVWTKNREDTYFHTLYDAVRGTGNTKAIHSNDTAAEGTHSAHNNLASFDSNGFTLGTTSSTSVQNYNNHSYVAWNWKANGSGSSNTNGSITSTVSANVDAGFSIVSYTGDGSSLATIGHGLSKAPELIHIKNRTDTDSWISFATVIDGSLDYMYLNLTNAKADLAIATPTSSVFSVDSGNQINGSGDNIIAYCFHSVDGYSKVGSYTGNASNATEGLDGTFVYTGFRPAWVMCKLTTLAGESWLIKDSERSPLNPADGYLYADQSAAEATGTIRHMDFLSNGFKFKGHSTELNGNGHTYIYIAFAETPFKYSNAR